MKVRATKPRFIGGRLHKAGEVFDIPENQFSEESMEKVDAGEPQDDEAEREADTTTDKPRRRYRKKSED